MAIRSALRLLLGLTLCGCNSSETPPKPQGEPIVITAHKQASLSGTWRAVLGSPGGELPFELRVGEREGMIRATAHNGEESVDFSSVSRDGKTVVFRIERYDSEIRAHVGEGGKTLSGTWTKTTPEGPSKMLFAALKGEQPRFTAPIEPPAHEVPASIDGPWSIEFREEDGSTFVGHAILSSKDGVVGGTILTDTGDYRYLEGRYENGTLELSCFDGGHAFLFRAAVDEKGALQGDFWSRAAYHATWSAERMKEGQASPLEDPFAAVALSPNEKEGRFRFAFPDASGAVVSDEDPRFEGKVVLIDIFGTWCPNCNDYAPLLAEWHRKYGPRGLEVVGLAFEFTGDAKRDRTMLDIYAKTHRIEFPLLLAGTSDKGDAAQQLPSIDVVKSYPTTVLVGRDGKVHKIHSGFAGPATGEHHTKLVAELEAEIEALLEAPAK